MTELQIELFDIFSDDGSTPPTRRTTRSALTEVPSTRRATEITPVWNHIHNRNTNVESLPTPSPSPDEMVIQQRGRRKVPATWSPIYHKDRTPVKLPVSSPKSTIVLRSTPRKRLLLGDNSEPSSPDRTPKKVNRIIAHLNCLNMQTTTPLKRLRLEQLAANTAPDSLPVALKGLSREQLVQLLVQVAYNHPDLEPEIKESLPAPDLKPMEDQLAYLKKNIFKSLPSSRLTSKFDSPAYNRASVHVLSFKKAVLDFGKQLVDSQNWYSVVDYVVMAWSYVKSTPLWENSIHNTARKQCFKSLAAYCMTALKKGSFQLEESKMIGEKLEEFSQDSDDMKSVLRYIAGLKEKSNTPSK